MFVLMRLPKVFFGQIWSQKLRFFKLTEIWYRGTLLYAYYDFNVCFFKILFIYVFLGANLVSISEILQIDWNFVQGYSLYAYYDFDFNFFKTFPIHIILGNLVLKSNVLQTDWKLIEGCIVIRWLRLSCVIFCS